MFQPKGVQSYSSHLFPSPDLEFHQQSDRAARTAFSSSKRSCASDSIRCRLRPGRLEGWMI